MKNDWNLEDYQLIQDKNKLPWMSIIFLFLAVLGVLILLYTFKFQIYEKQTLIKDNNEFLLIIDSKRINELESNMSIYINHKKYQYHIDKVDQDYTNMNGSIYQTVHINPYNYKTDSIMTECYFLKSEMSIFEMIVKFIRGGIK